MDYERGQRSLRLLEAKLAIVRYLRRCWPNSETITPRLVAANLPHERFVEAAQSLQDDGLVMYEVLLIGTGPEPELRDALLTRKGQLWAPGSEV